MVLMIKMNNKVCTSSSDDKEGSTMQLLLFLGLLLLPCSAVAACDQVDQDSLLSLAFKVPLNWSASTDCCSWEGISCRQDDDGQHVVRLWLPERGLAGVISPSITNLTYLTHLNLSHNSLLGPLPDDLFSSLSGLQVLDVSFNRLASHIPFSPNQTSQLQIINLSSNFLNGTIPSSILARSLTIFNVSNNSFSGLIPLNNNITPTSLTLLDLSFNKFSDAIPRGLGLCSKLQVFRAGSNGLSGSLPDDIFNLADLQHLSLPQNQLSGPISNGITSLTNLKVLELYSNVLSGSIPSDIGSLSKLENLLFHVNNLTGPLPPSLSDCTNLSTLNLRVNNLTGDLSAFNFSSFQRLTTLDLGNNNFTGELPRSLYSCKSLKAVRLASNHITGQISPQIVALESLAYLSMSSNNLTNATGAFRILMGCKNLTILVLSKNFRLEPMPDDDSVVLPDAFNNLQVLALGGCQLTGQLPSWLANLKNLQALDLSYNLITGSIPHWLGTLPNLFYLDLSNNLLAGGFPNALCRMGLTLKALADRVYADYLELPLFVMPNTATNQMYKRLSHFPPAIYLGNNSLSGNIPVEIGLLKFIHVLDLSHNNFSGNIPDQISELVNLEKLDFSYNQLTGTIPASFKSLHFMSYFNVAYNDLQGLIPSGGQFDTFSPSDFEGNPRLCGSLAVHRTCTQPLSPAGPRKLTDPVILITGIGYFMGFGIGCYVGTNKKFSF